jgi:hypothetical protein
MKSAFGVWVLVVVGVVWSPDLFGWPFWRFPAILLGLLAILIIIAVIRRRIVFRRKGYEVFSNTPRHEFEYREKHGGSTRTLKLPGELVEYGHLVYYRLTQEAWQEKVPEWAAARRLEIEEKMLENPFHRPI